MKTPSIQPAMQEIVDFINDAGFKTTDSGDGITNVKAGMEGAIEVPHVVIESTEYTLFDDARSIFYLLKERCCGFCDFHIEATYSPNDEASIIFISMRKIKESL